MKPSELSMSHFFEGVADTPSMKDVSLCAEDVARNKNDEKREQPRDYAAEGRLHYESHLIEEKIGLCGIRG